MNKIIILGNSGSGKSTFAKQLAEIIKIDYIHLDKLVYLHSWDKPEHENMEKEVQEVLKRDSWIIDGNYLNYAKERFDLCDTIFFLDINRFVCLNSIIKRKKTYKGKQRESRNSNVDEKITLSFINWVFFGFYRTSRKKIRNIIKNSSNKNIVVFKNRKQIKNYLKELGK